MLPPGPSRLAGLLSMVRGLSDHTTLLRELERAHGDPITLRLPIGTVVMTRDPAVVKSVYTAEPDTFESPMTELLSPFLGGGSLLLISGPKHRRARKLIGPPFQGPRIRSYGPVMRDAALRWTSKWEPGKPFSLLDTTLAISLDVIIRAVFGVTDEAKVAKLHGALERYVAAIVPSIAGFRFTRRAVFPPWARFVRIREETEALLLEEIRERRTNPQGREDVLGALVQARFDDGSSMDDREVLDHLLTVVAAGHETTGVGLTWAIYGLLTHPETLSRLHAEVDGLEPEALATAPYLGAVVQESLRRYPQSLVLTRKLAKPFTVKGFELEPGMLVGLSLLLHFDESIYPDAERFEPARFLERSYGPFELIPFGGGARRCIGAAFATHEMAIVLGTIVQRCVLSLVSPKVRPVLRAATVAPEHGLRVVYEGPRQAKQPAPQAAIAAAAVP